MEAVSVSTCDVAVIGAGGAGLRAAVAARSRGADVLVITKGQPGDAGTTRWAASDWTAYGAAFGHEDERDSPHEHWVDIMVKGGLVCRPALSRRIAYDAPERLLELQEWGARFDQSASGKFKQVLSDGARFPRACGRGAETGPMIVETLLRRCRELGVRFLDQTMVVDLLRQGEEPVTGCWGLRGADEQPVVVLAGAVVLAGGGAGKLYELNVFPPGMTGDCYAMALRAGASLVNMEFVQIGPSIVHPIHFALSGVFWRLQPKLTNARGQEFIERYFPDGVDIPAAIHQKGYTYPFSVRNPSKWVDVAVYSEIAQGRGTEHRGVRLDISHNPPAVIEEQARVPLEHLLKHGLDIRRSPVEFAPAIQHFNGGVSIDENAATEVPGLFAAGECAGGQHGADRPGGNALADCQVFGRIAGESATAYAEQHRRLRGGLMADLQGPRGPLAVVPFELEWRAPTSDAQPLGPMDVLLLAEYGGEAAEQVQWSHSVLASRGEGKPAEVLCGRLGRAMWLGCSVVRTEKGLAEAQRVAEDVAAQAPRARAAGLTAKVELQNLALVGRVVAGCARERTESRGTHYRADCDKVNDPEWRKLSSARLVNGELHIAAHEQVGLPPELEGIERLLEG